MAGYCKNQAPGDYCVIRARGGYRHKGDAPMQFFVTQLGGNPQERYPDEGVMISLTKRAAMAEAHKRNAQRRAAEREAKRQR